MPFLCDLLSGDTLLRTIRDIQVLGNVRMCERLAALRAAIMPLGSDASILAGRDWLAGKDGLAVRLAHDNEWVDSVLIQIRGSDGLAVRLAHDGKQRR